MPRLGQYEIAGEIGRGGMGIVYRGFDPLIGRDVAIKTVRLFEVPDAEERRHLQQRLEREAQSAGRLSHPNIVTIFQIGYHDWEPGRQIVFIAMEFVAGPTLAVRMAAGPPLDRHELFHILGQTAEALDYAHAHGVVHRDIKPANLLLSLDGRVKIADFGIARVSAHTMTQTGTMMGSPYYMAPEQVRAEAVDGRADQYSLAVLAYELLSGKRPFQADSFSALVYQVAHVEMPTEALLRAGLPQAATRVLRRALSKRPEQRFGSCRELVAELARSLQEPPVPLAAPAPGPVPLAAAAAGATAAVTVSSKGTGVSWRWGLAVPVLVVGGVIAWRQRPAEPLPPPSVVAIPDAAPVPAAPRLAALPVRKSPRPAPLPVSAAIPAPDPAAPVATPAPVVLPSPVAEPPPPPAPVVRTEPELLRRVNPVYTETARRAGLQGTVSFRVQIDEAGVPARLDLVRGLETGLDRNAAEAISQWRFSPATENGRPVPWTGLVAVEFRLVNGPSGGPPSLRGGGKSK